MDKRKNYYLVLDVEGAGDTQNAFVYDIGCAIADKQGKVYEKLSFVIRDIFEMEELMTSAYYSNKIPKYKEDIANGKRQMIDFLLARYLIIKLMKKWNVKAVCAYNANYDRNALNNTMRFLTNNSRKWFFPYGTEIHDIWGMCCQTLCKQKTYHKVAKENGWISSKGNIQSKAEMVYNYIMGTNDFEEEHTGLEDVLIEVELMAKAYKQHKKMEKNIIYNCWRLCQQVA